MTVATGTIAASPSPNATPGKAPDPQRGRANNFDFIRASLATLVIYAHSCQLGSGKIDDAFARIMHGQMSGGALAVDFFFVLSGFLIAKSWEQSRAAGDFVRKRVLRIYPGFAVTIAFCVFVVGPLAAADWHTYFRTARAYKLFDMLLLRPEGRVPGIFIGLPNAGEMNASLWTIRYELMCYVGILALGASGILRRRTWVLIIGLLAYAAYNRTTWNWNFPYWGPVADWPRLATFFLSGSIFYLFRDFIPHHRVLLVASLLALAVSRAAHSSWAQLSWTLPIFGTYALFYLAFSGTFRLHHFGRWGDFSYGLYLYAYPIQQLIVQRMGTAINPLILFALSLIITLILAVLSWHFVERPFLKLKSARRPAPQVQAQMITPLPDAAA